MPAPAQFRYRAFLSYPHADTRWAKWLHNKLEGFRIDKDLVGRETELGPIPKTLRPIFRDREDFSGGHTLTAATIAALDASAALETPDDFIGWLERERVSTLLAEINEAPG